MGAVTLRLGGANHTLRYTMANVERLYAEESVNLLDLQESDFTNPRTVRAILWCGMLHESPDLKLADVDFGLEELGAVVDAVVKSLPGGGEAANPSDGPAATLTPSD